jgi:putative holliday junction resolvase
VRHGIRLGIDIGSVRIGVSSCDRDGLIATPLETIAAVPEGRKRPAVDLDRIAALAHDVQALEVIIGLPRSLSGAEGSAAELVRAYADRIARRVHPVPVRLVDERLSTVTAHQRLREAGVSGRKRRPVIDQEAAVVILQTALDTERSTGQPPGSLVVLPTSQGGPR